MARKPDVAAVPGVVRAADDPLHAPHAERDSGQDAADLIHAGSASRGRDLWACLWFPQIALDAVPDAVQPARQPRVVTAGAKPQPILAANPAALRAGIRLGQPLASARTVCSHLVAVARDEGAERIALESMAALAWRYGADVSIAAPASVFVEVGASLSLFGGWPALQRRLCADLDASGFSWQLAAAPTAAAAQVFARCHPGLVIASPVQANAALAGMPLAAGLPPATATALQRMGLRTLGELFRLPRAALARRIGEPALGQLDRLRGFAPEALPRWRPAERYERRIAFEHPLFDHVALAFPLQRLLREFTGFLASRDAGAQRFTLRLEGERGHCTQVEVGLLAPQRDAGTLLELVRSRLEHHAGAHAVHALALVADELPPLCPLHRDLFDAGRSERLDWPALAERLRARLGDAALHGLACVADHRPARAWRHTPADASPPSPLPACLPRPFWLLRRPLRLRGNARRILAGPERIESGWWDDGDQRRDYYVVETHAGQRAWAFVEAGREAGPRTRDWHLHGWFA